MILREVKDLVGDEYLILGDYVSASAKVKVQHNKCGAIYGLLQVTLFLVIVVLSVHER